MIDIEFKKGEYVVSTDPAKLDVEMIHAQLTESYWAEGIPLHIVNRSIRNSLNFGLYDGASQIGYARVVSDLATFAYLADVFVLESHRGRGLGAWLIQCVREHPDLYGLRRWLLYTADQQPMYERYGFSELGAAENLMEIHNPDVYEE